MRFKAFKTIIDASGLGFPEEVIEMRWEHNGKYAKCFCDPDTNWKGLFRETRLLKKILKEFRGPQ